MKLIKYFFTIPFSPKTQWRKVHKELEVSKNSNEDAILIFLMMSIFSIGYSYLYSIYSQFGDFSVDLVILHYFKLVVVMLLTIGAVKGIGAAYELESITSGKIVIIVILGGGLITVLSNVLFLVFEDHLIYSLFGESFFNFFFLMISIFYISKGLPLGYSLFGNGDKITNKKAPTFLFIILLWSFNFMYSIIF